MISPAGALGGQFTFGFNSEQSSHDVGWTVADNTGGATAHWSQPVGSGVGPVHGPSKHIPTVSEWGMVVITLLVLTAGTVVLTRRP